MEHWRPLAGPLTLTVLASFVGPAPASGQEGELSRTFTIESAVINFGPVVTQEEQNFVRFGTNDGMEQIYALTVTDGHWYGSLRLAPTTVHVWPVADSIIESGSLEGRSADPRQSRWHYRVRGRATDQFFWGELAGGRVWTRSPFQGRLGGGVVQLSATDHGWWGAKTGMKPMVEAQGSVSWRAMGLHCRASVVHVGEPFGRWSVLEHAARDVGDSSVRRNIRPVACGVSMGFGGG